MYTNICVAGTFDGIHAGHEAMLTKAFENGRKVLIGLTSDRYVAQYKKAVIRPYSERYEGISRWVKAHGVVRRTTIVPIDDPFEPAASDKTLDALVVSAESKTRAQELNQIRVSRGLLPLVLIIVPLVPAEDTMPISTSRIRSGEINASGKLILPNSLRDELSKPLGRILAGQTLQDVLSASAAQRTQSAIITIGDVTTKTFLDNGVVPNVMIVDNKVNRAPFAELQQYFASHHFPTKKVASGPGFISNTAISCIQTLFSSKPPTEYVIEVEGEEDLLVLPAILAAPTGSIVYYGQPPMAAWTRFDSASLAETRRTRRGCGPVTKGVVEVIVTAETQRDVREILHKFTVV